MVGWCVTRNVPVFRFRSAKENDSKFSTRPLRADARELLRLQGKKGKLRLRCLWCPARPRFPGTWGLAARERVEDCSRVSVTAEACVTHRLSRNAVARGGENMTQPTFGNIGGHLFFEGIRSEATRAASAKCCVLGPHGRYHSPTGLCFLRGFACTSSWNLTPVLVDIMQSERRSTMIASSETRRPECTFFVTCVQDSVSQPFLGTGGFSSRLAEMCLARGVDKTYAQDKDGWARRWWGMSSIAVVQQTVAGTALGCTCPTASPTSPADASPLERMLGCGGRAVQPPATPRVEPVTDPGPWSRCKTKCYRDRVLMPALSPSAQALLHWQAGPQAGMWLTAIPAEAATTLPPQAMLVALRRRLRLARPLCPSRCGPNPGCGGTVDAFGDHALACPRTGLLARRAKVVERAWVRVARKPWGRKARSCHNSGSPTYRRAATGPQTPGPRRVWGYNSRWRALLRRAPSKLIRPAGCRASQAGLQLARGGPQTLLVLGSEIGGRWSTGPRRFVRDLVRLRPNARLPPSRAPQRPHGRDDGGAPYRWRRNSRLQALPRPPLARGSAAVLRWGPDSGPRHGPWRRRGAQPLRLKQDRA